MQELIAQLDPITQLMVYKVRLNEDHAQFLNIAPTVKFRALVIQDISVIVVQILQLIAQRDVHKIIIARLEQQLLLDEKQEK